MKINNLHPPTSDKLTLYRNQVSSELFLPLFSDKIAAGFPSSANDYIENHLDLNQLMIKHPSATFFVRVEGDSMKDAGIASGDLLVVDRSISPAHGKIVVAILDGEFTVKRLMIQRNVVFLVPENSSYSPIKVKPDSQFQVWGIVTYVIHQAK